MNGGPEILQGATWSARGWPFRGNRVLTRDGAVVASLTLAHMRWRRRATGTYRGTPWVFEEHPLGHFTFREPGSTEAMAAFSESRGNAFEDQDGRRFSIEGDRMLDDVGVVVLERRRDWRDGSVPTLRMGPAAGGEPRLSWLVLMWEYVIARENTWARADVGGG